MPILDVSKVTRAMTVLLEQGVAGSPVWGAGVPTVVPLPPDQVSGDALGFYLYHVGENPAYKNLPEPPGAGGRIRHTPMGLSLHYQLTAHHATDTALSLSQSQLLMGCALKVLHDHPVVDDTTRIGATNVLQSAGIDGTGSVLRVAIEPIPPADSVHYWTAGTKPLRLSAYYEITTVLLEPDEPPHRAGRVLTRDVRIFTRGAPHLDGTSSVRTFQPPGEPPSELEVRPAQVTYGGRFALHGTDLAGDEVALLLRPAGGGGVLRPETDPWGILATPDKVTAVVGRTADGRDVLPGVYGAAVEVVRGTGSTAPRMRSNEVPVMIEPEVTAVGAVQADGSVQVTGYPFVHAGPPALEVEVFAGGSRLTERTTAGALQPGEFRATAATTLMLRLPAGTEPGLSPLRILVNGAESPPRWIDVP